MKKISNNRSQYKTRASLSKNSKPTAKGDSRKNCRGESFEAEKNGFFVWNQCKDEKKI